MTSPESEPRAVLGPYEVLDYLGQGGMAEVWRGRHRLQGFDVAIKFLALGDDATGDERLISREIRAVAGLEHPGIVGVYDSGRISKEEAEASGWAFAADTTYLVMELAAGTLLELDAPTQGWPVQYEWLQQLLRALSHAHSRGVVHCDLKPGNVLYVPGPDRYSTVADTRLMLTDFGLAQAMQRGGRGDESTAANHGSPQFMAPERIRWRVRDQGPWTDLYSLGCLAYWLVCGKTPFEGGVEEVLDGQLTSAPPALSPMGPVPAGLDAWIERLLAKDPVDRYRLAADAAAELARLAPINPTVSTTVDDEALWLSAATEAVDEFEAVGATAPMADDWRGSALPAGGRRVPSQRHGAGLGVFGLRKPDLVGRYAERDRLWTALKEVHEQRRPQGVVIRGPAGSGVSRLASWLTQRALETGAALTLWATHHRVPGRVDGLPDMLARGLQCVGLSAEKVADRLYGITGKKGWFSGIDPFDCELLAQMIAFAAVHEQGVDGDEVGMLRAEEGQIVVGRWLRRWSEQRPVILVIDDAQWGAQALALAHHLLSHRRWHSLPVLVVLTVSFEADDQPAADDAISALQGLDHVATVDVEPLSKAAHRMLVSSMLDLAPALADEVTERTLGSPLFAVQLLEDWVDRKILKPTPLGYVIADDSAAALPEDMAAMVHRRLEELLDRFSERRAEVEQSLEIAAALGRRVNGEEWRAACALAEVAPDSALLDEMIRAQLIVLELEGWRFVHQTTPAALKRRAKWHQRWASHNHCCAQMLEERYGEKSPFAVERIAHHWQQARCWEKALPAVLATAKFHGRNARHEQADHCFERYAQILDRLGAAADERRRVKAWLSQSVFAARQGQLERCNELLAKSEQALATQNLPDLECDLAYGQAWVNWLRGDLAKAFQAANRAVALGQDLGDKKRLADALYTKGHTASWRGVREVAAKSFEQALELFEALGDDVGRAKVLMSRSHGLAPAAGVELIAEGIAAYEKVGDRFAMAVGYGNQGAVYHSIGELDKALESLRKGRKILERSGLFDAALYLNLCSVLVATGEFDEARVILLEMLPVFRQSAPQAFLGAAFATLLPCHADRGDWQAFDTGLAEVVDHLKAHRIVDEELATTLQLAGEMALKADEEQRARQVLRLAHDQWKALGNKEGLAEIEDYLRG